MTKDYEDYSNSTKRDMLVEILDYIHDQQEAIERVEQQVDIIKGIVADLKRGSRLPWIGPWWTDPQPNTLPQPIITYGGDASAFQKADPTLQAYNENDPMNDIRGAVWDKSKFQQPQHAVESSCAENGCRCRTTGVEKVRYA